MFHVGHLNKNIMAIKGTLILGNATFNVKNPNTREEIYTSINIHEIEYVLAVTSKDYTKLLKYGVTDVYDAYVCLWSVDCKVAFECEMPPKITLEEIKNYLKRFGTKVKKNDSSAYIELMVDNHKCIEWLGVEYYVPDGSSTKTLHEWLIYDFLVCKHYV
jgi:hypothetical protein